MIRKLPRKLWTTLLVITLLIVCLILALPTMACRRGWIQHIVANRLAEQGLESSFSDVRIGWFQPLEVSSLHVQGPAGQWRLSADKLQGERSLWQWIRSPTNLGTFRVVQPTLEVAIDEPFQFPERDDKDESADAALKSLASVGVRLEDGRVLVRSKQWPEPQEVAAHVHLDAQWQQSAAGGRLTIAPTRPLDHVALTPEMCVSGLQYVAPILAETAWTRGEISLELDACDLFVTDLESSRVKGRVSLHAVEAGLRSPLAVSIAQTVASVARRELPQSIRIADESVIEFALENGRVSHSGLAFGLPEVAPELVIRTEGSVGLDRTLDLIADIPLPLQLLGDGPLATALGNQTLHLPVKGTLDKPEINFEGDGQLVSELVSGLLGGETSAELPVDDLLKALQQLRANRQERRQDQPTEERSGPLFPRLRERLRGRTDSP